MGGMSGPGSTIRPDWVSDELYPFRSRFFAAPAGHRLHYIDEGAGEPVIFVHGNPSWSFEFRHPVQALRSEFRCIAPDRVVSALRAFMARTQSGIRNA